MKHFKRILAALLLVSGFVLAGCSSSSSSSSSSSTNALPQPSVNCGGSSCID